MRVFVMTENFEQHIVGVFTSVEKCEEEARKNYAERYPSEEVAFEKDFDIHELELDQVNPAGFMAGVALKKDEDGVLFWKYEHLGYEDDENARFYCYAHTDDLSHEALEKMGCPGCGDRARAFHRTDFQEGEVVYPVFFHSNDRGGWTVYSADGKRREYWQMGR